MDGALDPELEAAALCAYIEAQVLKYETLQEQLDSLVQAQSDAIVSGPSAISQEKAALLADEFTADVLGTAGGHLLPAVQLPVEIQAVPVKPLYEVENLVVDGAVDWAADDGGIDILDSSSVDRMLASNVKPATASKYGRIWDKWAAFATFHEVEIMPPEVRALDIFIVDLAELSGSSGVALTAAAAVAHFCALQGFGLPCYFPRFGKLLRGIRLTHGKAAKAKEPGSHRDIHGSGMKRYALRVEGGTPPGSVFSAVATRG
jgi:hypothetical protein